MSKMIRELVEKAKRNTRSSGVGGVEVMKRKGDEEKC